MPYLEITNLLKSLLHRNISNNTMLLNATWLHKILLIQRTNIFLKNDIFTKGVVYPFLVRKINQIFFISLLTFISWTFATAKAGDDFPFRAPQFRSTKICQPNWKFFEKILERNKMHLSAKYRQAQRNYKKNLDDLTVHIQGEKYPRRWSDFFW